MKRPRSLYLVAAWCCLGLLTQTGYVIRPTMRYLQAEQSPPMLFAFLIPLGLAFVVWQTVGLARLRPFYRWFATVFFAWWTISTVWNTITILSRRSTKPATLIMIFVALVFNVLSVWYLSRRSFREFSVQFVTEQDKEKHSREMQEISQRKILKDIR